MTKALNKRIVWNFFKMIKGIHKKPSANIIFKGECNKNLKKNFFKFKKI